MLRRKNGWESIEFQSWVKRLFLPKGFCPFLLPKSLHKVPKPPQHRGRLGYLKAINSQLNKMFHSRIKCYRLNKNRKAGSKKQPHKSKVKRSKGRCGGDENSIKN